MQPPQIDNQARLQALLAPQENVQEALVVDLSHDLRFSPSSLVLTDTRLLALDGRPAPRPPSRGPCARTCSCA